MRHVFALLARCRRLRGTPWDPFRPHRRAANGAPADRGLRRGGARDLLIAHTGAITRSPSSSRGCPSASAGSVP
jgi:hypothetical protein